MGELSLNAASSTKADESFEMLGTLVGHVGVLRERKEYALVDYLLVNSLRVILAYDESKLGTRFVHAKNILVASVFIHLSEIRFIQGNTKSAIDLFTHAKNAWMEDPAQDEFGSIAADLALMQERINSAQIPGKDFPKLVGMSSYAHITKDWKEGDADRTLRSFLHFKFVKEKDPFSMLAGAF